MEPHLQLTANKSEALQKIRKHWVSRTAHDIRGPLFAGRGYARLLLQEPDVTATQRKYAANILENMNRLAELVGALGDFPSESALDLNPVDLRDLLHRALDTMRARATLHLACVPNEPVWTVADGAKVSTAVHKLLTSLVDFSRSDARIEVRASQEDDEFVLRCFASGGPATPPDQPCDAPDIDTASRILRLHGGTASAGVASTGVVHVTLRLPLIESFR